MNDIWVIGDILKIIRLEYPLRGENDLFIAELERLKRCRRFSPIEVGYLQYRLK